MSTSSAVDVLGDVPVVPRREPHPVVWMILYLPFGALSGFIAVPLTFLATQNGLSISEGALLVGAGLLSQWLKWLWAPIVDITLTPKRWYFLSTLVSALGVFAMAVVPMSPTTLGPLLAVIAVASLVNSMVGMAVESLIASSTSPSSAGRVSAWFQAGNLGGGGLGGGLGLYLLKTLPSPWMTGAIMASLFMACGLALRATPDVAAHKREGGVGAAVKGVASDLWAMLKTQGGLLSAVLCILPIGTGAAQGALTQAKVAENWGAGDKEVALLQGVIAGLVLATGCFAGGWLCKRFHPRIAYVVISVVMALVTASMGLAPKNIDTYIVFSLLYSFTIGVSYSAFTAFVLNVMGPGAAATKYNVYASLSNFPIWWLGLVLGLVADRKGPSAMLLTESACGILGICIFAGAGSLIRRTKLAP